MKKALSLVGLLVFVACAEAQHRGATDAYVRLPDGPLDCPPIHIGLIGCPATLHDQVADCGCVGASEQVEVHYLCRGGQWHLISGTCPPLSASHQ
jgi:hypothetical protein